MPLYSYICKDCNTEQTKINRITNHESGAPICCGKKTTQTITASSMPMVNASSARHFDNYVCPVSEEVVTSERQRNNIEAKHEITRVEKGMFKPRKKQEAPDLPDALKPELAKYRKEINA